MLGRPNESFTNVVVCLVGDHSLDIGSRWNLLCYTKKNQRISDGTVLYTHDRTNITFLFGENLLKANLQISKVKQTLYIGHLVKFAFIYSG